MFRRVLDARKMYGPRDNRLSSEGRLAVQDQPANNEGDNTSCRMIRCQAPIDLTASTQMHHGISDKMLI